MASTADSVVAELLAGDPALRPFEKEVRAAADAMLRARPDTLFREEFRAELRRALDARAAEILARPGFLARFWPAFAGVAFAAFAGLVVVRPMLQDGSVRVPAEPAPELAGFSDAADSAPAPAVAAPRLMKSAAPVHAPENDLSDRAAPPEAEGYSVPENSSVMALRATFAPEGSGSAEPGDAALGASLMAVSAVADAVPAPGAPRYSYAGAIPSWSGALAVVSLPYSGSGSGVLSAFRGLPTFDASGIPVVLPDGREGEDSPAEAISRDEILGAAERGGNPGPALAEIPADAAALPLGKPAPCWLVASGESGWTLTPALAFPAGTARVVVPVARSAK